MIELPFKSKILFVVPHADDLEFGTGRMAVEALLRGNEVVEMVMTNSAYGTTRNDFKGRRIMALRRAELDRTGEHYLQETGNELRLDLPGYIDGFLKSDFTSAFTRLVSFLEEFKPSVLFAPDPVFSVDHHADHLATGNLAFLAAARLPPASRPGHMFLYYSYAPNTLVSVSRSTGRISRRALLLHRSQVSPRRIKTISALVSMVHFLRAARVGTHCDKVRSVEPGNLASMSGSWNFFRKIMNASFARGFTGVVNDQYTPRPADLGLVAGEGW